MAIRLGFVFGLQSLLIAAGFIVVVSLTLLKEKQIVEENVASIISATMDRNVQDILAPLESQVSILERLVMQLRASNRFCKAITNGTDHDAHVPTWLAFNIAMQKDPVAAFAYETWKIDGVKDPYHPSIDLWEECGCEQQSQRCGRNYNATRYAYKGGNDPQNFTDATPVAVGVDANPGKGSYVQDSIQGIPHNASVAGMWTLPYVWGVVSSSGATVLTTLYSYYICQEWSATTHLCTHSVGIDVSLDSITSIIASFAVTPQSYSAIVDLNSNQLLAHSSRDFPQLDVVQQAPFKANATPSVAINVAVQKCHSATFVQSVLEIGGGRFIVSSHQMSAPNGINLLLIDVTPRSYYFATLDDSITLGIIIGVVVPVVVCIISVLVWLSVALPLLAVGDHMVAAATMRADKVGPRHPFNLLVETMRLQEAYETMHCKLLELRPFVPQALFVTAPDTTLGSSRSSLGDSKGSILNPFKQSQGIPTPTGSQGNAIPCDAPAHDTLSAHNGSSATFVSSADLKGSQPHLMLGSLSLDNLNKFQRVNCTVMYVHSFCNYADLASMNDDVDRFLGVVITTVVSAGGVIELLHPDAIVVSFGAQSVLASHQSTAASAAVHIVRRLPRSLIGKVSLVLDTAEYLVGICGGSSRFSKAVFGERWQFMMRIHELASEQLRSTILLTEKAANALTKGQLIPVDFIIPRREGPLSQLSGGMKLFELLDSKWYKHDELVGSLEHFKIAFGCMLSGDFANATKELARVQCDVKGRTVAVELEHHKKRFLHVMEKFLLHHDGGAGSFIGKDGKPASFEASGLFAHYERKEMLPFETFGIAGQSIVRQERQVSAIKDDDLSLIKSRNASSFVVAVEDDQHPPAVPPPQQGATTVSDEVKEFTYSNDSSMVNVRPEVMGTTVGSASNKPLPDDSPALGKAPPEQTQAFEESAMGPALFEMFVDDEKEADNDDGELPLQFEDKGQGVTWTRSKQLLGSGAFASVFRGISSTGMFAALKCIDLSSRQINTQDVVLEVNTACKLHHENIVNHISWLRHNRYLIIAMEFVPGGSLMHTLDTFGPFQLTALRRFAVDCLNGLSYLHSKGITHADIKPHNMLIAMDGACKLSDFGSSVVFSTGKKVDIDVYSIRGTPMYMSKEVANGDAPTPMSDIWSLGISLYQLFTGSLPWRHAPTSTSTIEVSALMRNDAMFMQAIGKGNVVAVVGPEVGGTVRDFLTLCLNVNPKQRPTAQALLKHPLFL